jgi:hypothetical protein
MPNLLTMPARLLQSRGRNRPVHGVSSQHLPHDIRGNGVEQLSELSRSVYHSENGVHKHG